MERRKEILDQNTKKRRKNNKNIRTQIDRLAGGIYPQNPHDGKMNNQHLAKAKVKVGGEGIENTEETDAERASRIATQLMQTPRDTSESSQQYAKANN